MPKPKGLLINGQYALAPNCRSGGMADVYQATDIFADMRRVAVKVFKHGQIEEAILAESFRRETQALKELKHSGIVELLDSGIDEDTGHYFLVLEWMEKDLTALLLESPPEGWDSFWQAVALPVLEALAFSHAREYVHRDLKPNNILVDGEGRVKLADFGISKLKSYLQPGITLVEFVSRPFTPPEYDDGSYTYTRDIFSFGVVVLKCLTDVAFVDYDSIDKALAELDAPPPVLEVIERAVSRDPAQRQHNAEVLLAELKAIQEQREKKQPTRKRACYLELSQTALKNLRNELNIESQDEIQRIAIEDLNTGCGISYKKKSDADNSNQEFSEEQYSIFGVTYRYLAAVNRPRRDRLFIINAQQFSSVRLEQNREFAWVPPYEFRFGKPLNVGEAEDVIRELQLAVEEHEANLKQTRAEEEKQRRFRIWADILRAKTDWEKNRETPISYRSVSRDGNRAIFQLSSIPEDDIAGQPRHIIRPDGRGSILAGEVEEVRGNELILYISKGDPECIPKSGELLFDTRAAMVALYRQKEALDAVRFDRAVRADLRSLLVNLKEVQTPELEADVQFIQTLNESQQEAVRAALSTQDFLIVEGPPGTGKTTFITEVILQTLQRNPDARILLSSQTHVALDNALERIQAQNPKLKLVRIGNHERVSENVQFLLLEEQMNQWRDEVLARGRKFITDWSTEQGISQRNVEIATLFQELKKTVTKIESLRTEVAKWQQELDDLLPTPYAPEKPESLDKLEEIQNLETEILSLRDKLKLAREDQREKAKRLHQLSRTDTDVLRLSCDQLDARIKQLINPNDPKTKMIQQLLEIQADWFDLFGRSTEFNAPLLKRSRVIAGTCIGIPSVGIQDVEFDVCIVDEASKATATEVLVPLSRSHRWILVGDPKQLPPFLDETSRNSDFLNKYELTQDDIRETLFDLLLGTLPNECHKMLKIQHRMVEPIGNLVSECFYGGKLKSAKKDLDQRLLKVLPKPVTWLTTTKLPNHRERASASSYINLSESEVIRLILERLNSVAREAQDKPYSIAVLTGYAAQRNLIERTLASELSYWEWLKVECNTVDAFQGREADIAIYSVTRSNNEGKIGFLSQTERLNVALSRGKAALAIVGDHNFCRTVGDNPLRDVLEYIENHPETSTLMEAKS